MQVHLIDGTYELFRHFFAVPSHVTAEGREVGATRGVLGSLVTLLEQGATHVAVATDHVIESWRNDLWPGYKTGAGVDPNLLSQFTLLEEVLAAAGLTVWAMVEWEADDALASGAAVAAADPRVERVLICTPDKDLAQSVVGERVVQLDRRRRTVTDEAGVLAKFGVEPASIPDYLALVGDAADGFPGLPGWGARSAAAVLRRYRHLDAVPASVSEWDVAGVRNAGSLAATLTAQLDQALLFRRLATLDADVAVGSVDQWRWRGPAADVAAWCGRLDAPDLATRLEDLARRRGG